MSMTERLRSHIVGLEVSDSWMTNTSVKVVNQLSSSNRLFLSLSLFPLHRFLPLPST